MNKTIIIVGICIGLLFGWVIGFYHMKWFFYDPTFANLTQLKETLENTKRAYEEQIELLQSQKTWTEDQEAKLREARKEYDALINNLHQQIADMRIEFNNKNPYLGVAAFGTILIVGFLLIWLMMESNENKKTVERLARLDSELVKKLTAYQLPQGKVIDTISSPPDQNILPEEQSPDLLPKD